MFLYFDGTRRPVYGIWRYVFKVRFFKGYAFTHLKGERWYEPLNFTAVDLSTNWWNSEIRDVDPQKKIEVHQKEMYIFQDFLRWLGQKKHNNPENQLISPHKWWLEDDSCPVLNGPFSGDMSCDNNPPQVCRFGIFLSPRRWRTRSLVPPRWKSPAPLQRRNLADFPWQLGFFRKTQLAGFAKNVPPKTGGSSFCAPKSDV